jgi:uncharacterized membrane protein YcaP (DUF421 family)
VETVIRVALIYIIIIALIRIIGKRELGQFSPLELVTLLLAPELVSQGIIGDDFSLTNAVIAVATLFGLVFLFSLGRYLSQTFESFVTGTPRILVSHGQLIEDNLNRERVDPQELFGEMHKSGLYRLDQVKWAILETDGKIAFVPEDESD